MNTALSLPEFADRLNEIMPAISKQFARRQENELSQGAITLAQYLILDFLHGSGASRMTDVALFLYVTTAAATGIVDRLVRQDYVERVYEPLDRRLVKIKLTSKGLSVLKKIRQQKRETIMEIFGKISQAQRQEYLGILMRLHGILIKEDKQNIK